MSAPIDQIRIQTLPSRDNKAHVEEDAKRVFVNPQVNGMIYCFEPEVENPKSQIQNPKQIPSTKQNEKP